MIDRPGLQPPLPPPGSCCGCGGNDIDAVLNDAATDPVEDECAPMTPTIHGEFIPGDPPRPQLLTQFEGLELCGTWELNVADRGGADVGGVFGWCLLPDPPDDVPSTTIVGVIVTTLLLLGTSGYVLRRRATD